MSSVLLTWTDNSTTEEGQRVYRSDVSTAIADLGPPIAVLAPDVTQYADDGVVEGYVYYYRVSAFQGLYEVFSAELRVVASFSRIVAPTNVKVELVEHVPLYPTVIGEAFGGGYYVGNITIPSGGDAGTYAIIMGGPESQATLTWKNPRLATAGTDSTTDGRANTLAMQASDPAIHHAGMHCLNYRGGGHDDWYLGAKDELNLAWLNRTVLAALAMEAEHYWSSTQYSATRAWGQNFSNGGQDNYSKSVSYRVRPFRRIKLPE